jgi:site-specific recombinase XerC
MKTKPPNAPQMPVTVEQYLDVLTTQRKLSEHTTTNYRRDLLELIALNAAANGTELAA